MKIILVHTPPDLYGASRSLFRLSARLIKDGHSVTVILDSPGKLRDELLKNGVGVIIHGRLFHLTREKFKKIGSIFSAVLSFPVSVIQLIRIIKKNDPDLIHTNTALIVSPAVAAYLTKKKHIWHIRETFVEFGLSWRIYRKLISLLSDKIIAVSKPVGEQFDPLVYKNKVIILNNGFPLQEFIPVEPDRILKFKKSFGLNGGILAGVVGRIKIGRKGQETFVKAVSLLKDKYPDAQFAIIGSPFPGNEEHLRILRDLIKELNLETRITITCDVEDIKAAISALDISVLPSGLPEPFGGVVIESMALGKPVIGTNIGGTTEQIIDGETGYLIEPNDPEALAEALEKLILNKNIRIEMGKRGRERFIMEFEFENFYKKLLGIYTESIGSSK